MTSCYDICINCGEDNIKLLIKYINNQIKRGIKEKTEAKKIN